MGVTSFSFELVCSVTPARMFKASVLDLHNLAPKIMPQVVSGAGLIEGDGGVGSVKQFKFTDAVPFSHVNERIDALDKEKLEYKYTVTEGGDVGTKLISAVYHVKFVPAGNGECLIKATAEFTPVSGVQYTDEEANIQKEGVMGMFQAVEAHLLENPDAYA
ncbi:pathogenesis-related protein 1-like [Magnolia sinica]|uniref:pathogenesis-related protein 1-like n=1 Tax=Magnolia sinica TaxID=86752 RepID=UPI002658B92D|nr:pathogenesis-related protein 1-like [Magnolia sinica]